MKIWLQAQCTVTTSIGIFIIGDPKVLFIRPLQMAEKKIRPEAHVSQHSFSTPAASCDTVLYVISCRTWAHQWGSLSKTHSYQQISHIATCQKTSYPGPQMKMCVEKNTLSRSLGTAVYGLVDYFLNLAPFYAAGGVWRGILSRFEFICFVQTKSRAVQHWKLNWKTRTLALKNWTLKLKGHTL